MVPENIHTPTTEGIRNSRGVGGGGGQKLRKFQRDGGVDSQIKFQMVQYRPTAVVVRKLLYLPTLVERSEVRKGFA